MNRMRFLSATMTVVAVMAITGTAFAQVAPPSGGMTMAAPPVAQGTYMATVTAADQAAAGEIAWVTTFFQKLDATIATQFGWRPSQPTTLVLFSSNQDFLNALNQTRTTPLTNDERMILQNSPSFLVKMVPNLGGMGGTSNTGWAILVNLDTNSKTNTGSGVADPSMNADGPTNWQNWVDAGIAKAYAQLMVQDLGGNNVPMWFQQGLSDGISFAIVPGTSNEMTARAALASARATSTFPSLTSINNDYATVNAASPGVVQAIDFIAATTLINKAGGMQVASMLGTLKSGQSIDRALQAFGNSSLEQLNMDYQSGLQP